VLNEQKKHDALANILRKTSSRRVGSEVRISCLIILIVRLTKRKLEISHT